MSVLCNIEINNGTLLLESPVTQNLIIPFNRQTSSCVRVTFLSLGETMWTDLVRDRGDFLFGSVIWLP